MSPDKGGGGGASDNDKVRAAFRLGWTLIELAGAVWEKSVSPAVPPTPEGADAAFPPALSHTLPPDAFVKATVTELIGVVPKLGPSTLNLSTLDPKPDAAKTYDADGLKKWDVAIVEALIDEDLPLLDAYESGKGLCRLYWQARFSSKKSESKDGKAQAVPVDVPLDTWKMLFPSTVIGKLRRHVLSLGAYLDGAARDGASDTQPGGDDQGSTGLVAASLAYWARAIDHWGDIAKARSGGARKEETAPPKELIDVLDEQRGYWFDLLAGRRKPDSFSSPDVEAALLRNVLASSGPLLWKVLAVFLTLGLIIVIVLIAAAIAGAVAQNVSHSSNGLPGYLFGGGTALAGFGALVATWRTWVTKTALPAAQQAMAGAGAQAQAIQRWAAVDWGTLAGVVGADAVGQLRREARKVSVSDPLMRFVLDRPSRTRRKLPWRRGQQQALDRLREFLRIIEADATLETAEGALSELHAAIDGARTPQPAAPTAPAAPAAATTPPAAPATT